MSRKEEIEKLVEAASKEFADRGLLIAAGWAGFRLICIPPDAPQIQLDEMKMAFFGGAQHLFTSIMTIMDEDHEPTDDDMRKMSLIDTELEEFLVEFKKKHNIGD